MTERIAVVTGANRGMGLETARQLAQKGILVILTSRHPGKGAEAAEKLRNEGLEVDYHRLDVTDEKSAEELRKYIEGKYGKLDILVNNAGVFLETEDENGSVFRTKLHTVRQTLEVNTMGPLMVSQALIPLMQKENYGRIVNVSSGMGQLSEMSGRCPGYRLSKAALNAVTRILADELRGTNIKVNSVCPGWVRTDMGTQEAERSVEEGVDTTVWLATLPDDGPTGGFFRDRKKLEW